MAFPKSNPAALADAGRARYSFNVLPTLNGSEISDSPPDLQGQRAAWLARQFAIPAGKKQTSFALAFGEVRS